MLFGNELKTAARLVFPENPACTKRLAIRLPIAPNPKKQLFSYIPIIYQISINSIVERKPLETAFRLYSLKAFHLIRC